MKIKAIYLHFILIGWVGVLFILLRFFHINITGLGITLTFLSLILIPGFLILRLLKISNSNLSARILNIIGLGFCLYFLVNLIGILFNLTIFQVIWLNFILIAILFIIAIFQDRKNIFELNFSWFKEKMSVDWLMLAVIISSLGITLFTIDAQSDRLIGDGYFHLAILQKVISGNGLTPANLWVVKDAALNPVYSFPIWHIFVGLIAKILNISGATALTQSMLPLSILAMVMWYCLLSIVLRNKYLVVVTFLTFLLIMLKDSTFYFLLALPSPDSFNRLFILPLIIGLIVNFLFNKDENWVFNIVLISLLAIFLGLIHFVQFIYLIVILIILVILLLIFYREKLIFKKLLILCGGLGIIILPYLVIQWSNVSSLVNASLVAKESPKINSLSNINANVIYRYAILTLPILVLFVKKQVRMTIFLAIPLAALFIYWPFMGLQSIFLKIFGEIFVQRALANIPHFIYFGFILFLLILGLNYFCWRIFQKLIWLANIILVILFGIIILNSEKLANFIKNIIFSEERTFVGPFFWISLIILILGSVIIWVIFKYRHKEFNIQDPFDKLNFLIIAFVLIYTLSLPYQEDIKFFFTKKPNCLFHCNRIHKFNAENGLLGGENTINFLESLHGQVFLSDNVNLIQILLLYSNNFAAEYPYGIKDFTLSKNFFKNSDFNSQIDVLNNLKVDYIIIRDSNQLSFFEENPDYFQNVFENHYFYQKPRDLYIFKYTSF